MNKINSTLIRSIALSSFAFAAGDIAARPLESIDASTMLGRVQGLSDSLSYNSAVATETDIIYLSQNEKFPISHEFSWLSEKSTLLHSLNNLSSLENGWDGYDAAKINEEAINDAKYFARSFPRYLTHPNAVPVSGGEVCLYWRTPESYIELGFEGDGTYYVYARHNDSKYRNDSISLKDGQELPKELLKILLAIRVG